MESVLRLRLFSF